ncbi:AAA family ATPase [Streptomyces sp. NPDC090054]|uniref:AAA family ATPase n=1 Tax=Streptomyces sp. NPDC090054 TaxID=3365933 RepID=UPI00380AD995
MDGLEGITRRRLVVVAITGYGTAGDEEFEMAIDAQVRRITDWLAGPTLDEGRRFEISRAPAMRSVQGLRKFLQAENLAAARYEEAVVVYITGHGLGGSSHRHYLMFADTKMERPLATTFPTSELISAVVDSESEHVLVLVDSCFSGTLHTELSALFRDLDKDRRSFHGAGVVTSGDFDEQPLIGSFTERVALAYERMQDEASGYTASHLSFQEWETLLDRVGQGEAGREKDLVDAEWAFPRSRKTRLSACLPNPRYQPAQSTIGPALRQLALTTAVGTDAPLGPLDNFWPERASGRAADNDPGWYFSGRVSQMRAMTAFLRGDEHERVLIVTGAAGSGKSALLARLVTLSDPGFIEDPRHADMVAEVPTELRPPRGSIDVAVLARNKSARVVVDDLLTALGTDTSSHPDTHVPLQELLRLLSRRSSSARKPVVIVIDALDEARDPIALLNALVLPLARLGAAGDNGGSLRLLLGVRSSPLMGHQGEETLHDDRADQLLQHLTEALRSEGLLPRIVRSDGPSCVDDIAAYVTALLLAPAYSPYRSSAEAATEAARTVADAVAPSFLDARIAADQLRQTRARQDLTEPGWLRRLGAGTSGLLRQDIAAVALSAGVSKYLLVNVLRATTFAPGAGLPWAEVWPAVTTALAAAESGPDVAADAADQAIRTLRNSRLAGYLATADEDGRAVYRPVHQRLADLLTADHTWLLDPPDDTSSRGPDAGDTPQQRVTAHAAITRALADLVERSRPHTAHPYVRRHFLHHAAAGEVLTDEGVPRALLVQETSETLRTRLGLPLPITDPNRRTLTAAALIEPYIDATVDMASRLTSITFQRAVQDDAWQPPQDLPARFAWGRWVPPMNVLAPPGARTQGICCVPTLDGRTLIAVLTGNGPIEIRDSASGRLTAEIGREREPVRSLQPIRSADGRTFLVVLGSHSASILDPTSGQPLAHVRLPYTEEAHVLQEGSAGWQVFVLTGKGAFLWTPVRGEEQDSRSSRAVWAEGFPPVRRNLPHAATAVVRTAAGRPLVAVTTPTGVQLWDPASAYGAARSFGGEHTHALMAVPRQGMEDLLLIRNGISSASLSQAWNPFLGERVPYGRIGAQAVTALPNGMGLAYAEAGWIVIRNLEGHLRRSFDTGAEHIDAIGAFESPGGPRIVSAGPQGMRIWDVDEDAGSSGRQPLGTQYQPPLNRSGEWPLCRSATGVVLIGTDTGLDVYDATSGSPLSKVAAGPVMAVEPIPSPPGTAYVALRGRADWIVWDLVGNERVSRINRDGPPYAPSCVARTPTNQPLFATVLKGGAIRIVTWDPASHETDATTVTYHHRDQEAHACAALPPWSGGGTTVIAVAATDGVELVDLGSGNLVRVLRAEGPIVGPFRSPCALRSQGRTLLASATSSALHVWDATNGTLLATCPTHDTLVLAELPMPDGRTLLASGNRSGLRLWDPLTGELRHTLLTGAPVHGLAAGFEATGAVIHFRGPAGVATLALNDHFR